MNTKFMSIVFLAIFALVAPSVGINQTPKYYQSDWTWISADQSAEFGHYLGSLPSFTEIYVADYDGHTIPESAVPYRNMDSECLHLDKITNDKIGVVNYCDQDLYVRVDAILHPWK